MRRKLWLPNFFFLTSLQKSCTNVDKENIFWLSHLLTGSSWANYLTLMTLNFIHKYLC